MPDHQARHRLRPRETPPSARRITRRTENPDVIRGVLAVLRRGPRVLLIRRAAHVRAGGVWCFPGGTIEAGESESEALTREIREELNLVVEPARRLLTLRKRRGRLVLYCWSARIVRGRIRANPSEVAEARWFRPRDVRDWPQVPGSPPCAEVPHLITGSLRIMERIGLLTGEAD